MNEGVFDPRRRLATPLSKLIVLSLFIFGWLASAAPAQDSHHSAVLFENVRVFDGKSAGLSGPTNVEPSIHRLCSDFHKRIRT
jgi:hypothetical protein